jgi:hypothetical protein
MDAPFGSSLISGDAAYVREDHPMSVKVRVLLFFSVIALVAGCLRFVPSLAISRGVTDFATGLGVGLLIGVLVLWSMERDT